MSNKYIIKYEVLVYNLPELNNFVFLEHEFITNMLDETNANEFDSVNLFLNNNTIFASCCFQYGDGHQSYITMKNIKPLEVFIDKNEANDGELDDKIKSIVTEKVYDVEKYLIFTTNLHIFFPMIKYTVYSSDEEQIYEGLTSTYRPIWFRKWLWFNEGISLEKRLTIKIDKTYFDKFINKKNHTRYKRAFDYYIRSFFEYEHSTAFCLLCASLDAITGKSDSNETKKRLAKYTSVLLCEPLKMNEINEELKKFYKLRSNFVHGKGDKIKVEDEIKLREMVRRFLMAYRLFWGEMGVKREQQMLQKIDEIYANPKLYNEYCRSAYTFMRLSYDSEDSNRNFENMNLAQKYLLTLTRLIEPLVAKPPETDEQDSKAINN